MPTASMAGMEVGSVGTPQIPHDRCAAVAPFSKGGWNSASR
jgi:hypothetical protein